MFSQLDIFLLDFFMLYNTNVCVIDHLQMKSKINALDGDISKDTLRATYSSNVQLLCRGSGFIEWEYTNSKLQYTNSVKRRLISTTDSNSYSVVTINHFDRTKMGFYTCRCTCPNQTMEQTILVTSGKLTRIIYS